MRVITKQTVACATAFVLTMSTVQAQEAKTDPLQTKILEDYKVLVGTWHPDPSSLSDSAKEWQKKNNIEDNWINFSWGPDHQWMNFGDWQRKSGQDQKSGAGLIAYDPSGHRIMFTEHGIRGASVLGTLSRPSSDVIIRDIVVTRTDRSWRQIDRWVWNTGSPDCFNWSTTYLSSDKRNQGKAKKWCRKPVGS